MVRAAFVLLVVGLALCGCAGGPKALPSTAAPTTAAPTTSGHRSPAVTATTHPAVPPLTAPPSAVSIRTVTLVDPSRATPARGAVPGHPGRVLSTLILRPTGVARPLPLVVFAHGWNSDPLVYSTLLGAWARAGYMVAAPTLPDSADTLPGSPISNYPAQAEDLSFVITSLLDGRAGAVDPRRIAVAGHSDGGTDVAYLALNPAYADHRIDAYLSLSGEIPDGAPGPWGVPTPGDLLVMVGSDDEYGLFPRSQQVFQTAMMTKALVVQEGGDHLTTYIGSSPQQVAMRAETVTFLNAALDYDGATAHDPTTPTSPTAAALGQDLPPADPSEQVQVQAG